MTDPLEEIARKAAEELVEVRATADGCRWLYLAGQFVSQVSAIAPARERVVGRLRDGVSALFLAALREALSRPPCAGGIDEERLAGIRADVAEDADSLRTLRGSGVSAALPTLLPLIECLMADRRDLLAHVDHLHGLFRVFVRDSEAYDEGRRAGFREGAKAQREACAKAAAATREQVFAPFGHNTPSTALVAAVRDAPLAAPDAPAG